MIGRLTGKLIEKKPPELLIDVAGIGYELSAPMSTFYHLPELNQAITLFTHLVTREDAQLLFGFYSEKERALFRSLIKISGVGPKLALTILSGIEPEHFVQAVMNNQSASLVRLPGVGKKTAERLIIEMRDKLKDWHCESASLNFSKNQMQTNSQNNVLQDAISALIALGYKPQDASKLVNKIYDADLTSEQLIKLALKEAA